MHLRNLLPLLGICLALRAHGALSPINNIDILEPIVRISPALSQPDKDFFGWSAILHQMQAPDTNDDLRQAIDKTRIIIGAPLGTFPGGLNLPDPFRPREKQTGLVYSCPIAPGECEGVRGDTSVYLSNETIANNNGEPLLTRDVLPQSFVEGRLFDQAPNARLILRSLFYGVSENKSGQLLGSTLFSSGNTFIACAPRWTDNRESPLIAEPRGVCYYSGRDLTGFQRLRPCVADTSGEQYCLAGKSAIEFMDYFILGAPGLNEGRGALFYSSSGNRATFMRGNTEQGPPALDIRDQYQGFVTIPAFITQSRTASSPPNIVTTVPRFNDDTYRGRINVYNPRDFMNLVTTVDAQGSQMGEFFGYSMIAVDINGDNYDDLVIGAPMNTDYTNLLIERGRIYIFINTGSGTLMSSIVLNGRIERGRFGTSLTNLGDINDDGYEDFAVGAPYERGNNSNTGAVYIYYGNANPSSQNLVEFKISADDIVARVTASGLNSLKTFGWSLSSKIDADNNEYRDLVVGAYESQTVFLLRTLPVATVTVDILSVPEVDLTSSFMVRVSASYTGRGVPGPISVPFVLSEDLSQGSAPRLIFANNGMGVFVLNGPGQNGTQMVSVTPLINTTSLSPYRLRLELNDIERSVRANFDGNQTIINLSSFPRLISPPQGDPTELVSIRNPCGNDGCVSDVMLHPPTRNITVTSGGMIYHDIDLFYQHVDGEDAVGLNFTLTNIPTAFISGVTIERQGSSPSETPCSSINSTGFATCNLQPRLQPRNSGMITVNFTVNQTALIGVDPTFSVGVEIVLQTEDVRDLDEDTRNNEQQIVFDVETRADISVKQLSFGGASFNYTGVAPTPPITSTVSLGQSVTLRVDVNNSGPSIIGDGSLNISLPYRIMDSQYLLYPTRIQGEDSSNGLIQCDGIVDPEGIDQGSPQTSESRRKRMAEGFKSRRSISPSSLKRVARQADDTKAVNCAGPDADPTMCSMISCRIRNLRPGIFTVSVFTRIDERFFANQATTYTLTASASVSVSEDFYGDDPDNNIRQFEVKLMPMPADVTGETGSDIIHYILWPCIGGIVLLILAAVLLYFVGFFRRKKKPDEGEIEGDFDVDQYKLKPATAEGGEVTIPEAPEASAPPQNSEDITKV